MMFVSLNFCLQTVQESSAELGATLTHTRAVGCVQCVFRECPGVEIKRSQHFGETHSGLPWFIPHVSLPHQSAVSFLSHPTSAVLSIPLLPAFTLTHRTAPGWPPDAQQSRGGPRSLLAGAVRPWHGRRVAPGSWQQPGLGGGRRRGAGTARGQWLASLPCRSPGARWAHVHSLLACCSGPEAARDSWVTLSTGTLSPGHPVTGEPCLGIPLLAKKLTASSLPPVSPAQKNRA